LTGSRGLLSKSLHVISSSKAIFAKLIAKAIGNVYAKKYNWAESLIGIGEQLGGKLLFETICLFLKNRL